MSKEYKIIGISFGIIVAVSVCSWFLTPETNTMSIANSALAARCEQNGDVMIEGVNDDGRNVNHFSVCVPFEALTCVDVE